MRMTFRLIIYKTSVLLAYVDIKTGKKAISRLGQILAIEADQSRPQSEFVALPLLWDTRGRSVI